MKEVLLTRIEVENFRCFSHKDIRFNRNTLITAGNGKGKTTLLNAYMWLLFDKLFDGSSATGIRPHDENGVIRNTDNISVTGYFEIDGKAVVLKKEQSMKFARNGFFEGNTNEYSINGIPKTQAEYKLFILENICDEATFLMCSNVQSFFRLDMKKRLKFLLGLVKNTAYDFTHDETDKVSEMKRKIGDEINGSSVDELQVKYSKLLKVDKKRLAEFPTKFSTLQDFGARLEDTEDKVFKCAIDMAVDMEVAYLKKKQKEAAQAVADDERMLDLLNQIVRDWAAFASKKINQHFNRVQWKLSETLNNGNEQDCCRAFVNGNDYEKMLNDGDCLLADIEILQTFQKMNGLALPIWLDRAESVVGTRIPKFKKGQLIVLKVEDMEELTGWDRG